MALENEPRYSRSEEIANSATHGLGAALAVAALAAMVATAAAHGDARRVVTMSIYGATLILMFLGSTLYHATRTPRLKRFFRVIDHSTIYLLIAGTYTPFTLVALRGAWGWTIFGAVWAAALIGILQTALFVNRFQRLSLALYLGMGWAIVVVIKPLIAVVPAGGLAWLIGGGLAYTVGVAFYVSKRLPFAHAIWHLFVLGGAACHFFGVWFYVLPLGPA